MQKLEYKPHPSAISIYLQKSTRLLSVPHKHGYIPTIVLHHSLYALGKGFCIYITYRNISSTGHSIPNLFIKKKKTQQYSPCFEEACYLYRIFFFSSYGACTLQKTGKCENNSPVKIAQQ